MDRRSWLLMLLLASFWGASYMFIEIGLRDLSPAAVAFTRIALASAVLAPIAWQQGAFRDLRGRGRWLVVTAAVQVAAPFWLIAAGQQEIASALAGILVSSAAIFTVVLAIWFDHEERATGMRLGGRLPRLRRRRRAVRPRPQRLVVGAARRRRRCCSPASATPSAAC